MLTLTEKPEPMCTPGDTLLGITVGKQYFGRDYAPFCCLHIVPEGKARRAGGVFIPEAGMSWPLYDERTPPTFKMFSTRTFEEHVMLDPTGVAEAPGTLEEGAEWIRKFNDQKTSRMNKNKVVVLRAKLRGEEDLLRRMREDVVLAEKSVEKVRRELEDAEASLT